MPAATDSAPIVLSVKFIDDEMLARHRRPAAAEPICAILATGRAARRFHLRIDRRRRRRDRALGLDAETAGRRDRQSVVPFIAVALAGFALLAAFVLRYMRRTAAAIAAGEDAIAPSGACTIRCAACPTAFTSASAWKPSSKRCARRPAGRGVLHRPRPLQGRQRHARPSGRRRIDPQRHAAAVAHAARQ